MSNRRDFLKNISLFTAGGLLAGKAGSVNAANAALGVVDEVHAGKEIGLQIYSLSQELYKDLVFHIIRDTGIFQVQGLYAQGIYVWRDHLVQGLRFGMLYRICRQSGN